MSYYPILEAPYCMGSTTLYNFPPNNWEVRSKKKQYLHLSFIKNQEWHHILIDELESGQCKKMERNNNGIPFSKDSINLFSLNDAPLPPTSKTLPQLSTPLTNTPIWRSTLALHSSETQTSYQGEINPFPEKASLLSFSPFLQYGKNIENFILLVSLEAKAAHRKVKVELYDAKTKELKSTQEATTNQITIISLDNIGFDEKNLPVVICRQMAAIPLYFTSQNRGDFLSLEHTHPPASLVVHGNRFKAQNILKQYWLSECKKNEPSD